MPGLVRNIAVEIIFRVIGHGLSLDYTQVLPVAYYMKGLPS